MKKRIANIVELLIEVAILVIFLSMKGVVSVDGGHHHYKELFQEHIFLEY